MFLGGHSQKIITVEIVVLIVPQIAVVQSILKTATPQKMQNKNVRSGTTTALLKNQLFSFMIVQGKYDRHAWVKFATSLPKATKTNLQKLVDGDDPP